MSTFVRVPARMDGTPHVYIATPAHTLHSNYALGLARVLPSLLESGIPATYGLLSGHAHVDDARNLLVDDFLKTNCTDLLFWDADVGCAHDAVERLLAHDIDVVAGVYPKDDSGGFPVRVKERVGRLVECFGVPTGFLRVRRAVLEKMARAASHAMVDGNSVPIIFERSTLTDADGRQERVGGDYNFCLKWRALGGKVFADPSLLFTHQWVVDFAGRLADTMPRTQAAAE